jgi:hypothetical protein
MQQYKTNLKSDFAHPLKDPDNMLLIRLNLHKPSNDRLFVFFPKGTQSSLVVHTLRQTPDLSQLYSNVQLHPIPHFRLEFLLARFAWSIFLLLGGPTSSKARQARQRSHVHRGLRQICLQLRRSINYETAIPAQERDTDTTSARHGVNSSAN